MAESQVPARRPFTASCHCGATRFVVFLTLAHLAPKTRKGPQDLYKCNCTVCQKTGIFHLRLASSPDDFLLLSPLDPYSDMGDYTSGDRTLHGLFCKTCAVRCFIFAGEGETVEVDLGELGVAGHQAGKTVTAWKPKKDGWREGREYGCYLSVNAYTVDANQDDFDLAEFTDMKAVGYYDYLRVGEQGMGPLQHDRPHKDGAY